MGIDKLGGINAGQAPLLNALDTPTDASTEIKNSKEGITAADQVAKKSFANKTVSLISKGIKTGLTIAIKGTFQIAKLVVTAAQKVGKAFASAIKQAKENNKTSVHLEIKPKDLQARKAASLQNLQEAQKNLASAIRNGKETIAKQKAAQQDRRDIAALERRARALKQDSPVASKKPNQDYTNFEKSSSTISANARLSPKDKQDIAALEQRLNALKKS